MGKKNWIFVVGETTGQRAAINYTLVECAKRHGHDPEAWLVDLLERLQSMTNWDYLSVLLTSRRQPAIIPEARTAAACPV